MRLHKNLCLAVIETLHQIFNEGSYADKAVQAGLKRDKRWGSRDRGFIAETTYDIVRHKRLYAKIANVNEPFSKLDLWRLLAVWITLRGYSLPDWKYFANTPQRRIKGRFDELIKHRELRESIPDWLDEIGVAELGEETWSEEISALNKQAEVVLRVNTLKTNRDALKDALLQEGIETIDFKEYPDALQLNERANVFTTKAFKDGLFEVQDASSQLVAPFLDVKPGMRVVDACAGAGGKSLHLASLMKNKGQVIALDIFGNKLQNLKRRARRNGVHNVETRLIESEKTIKKLIDKADRVLIDAPCSGLGVLKRNPDAKWKLSPEFLSEVKDIQSQLLKSYSRMVKAGGKLVYATCSILPSENKEQVDKFLKSEAGKDFIFVSEKVILSSQSGYDGFYMALLERNQTA
ncbi:MAG: methyltransferase domain-containing protein [Flavobacteriaceae bacterium]|nr:methyltransferase domain-containing protein [Bacteroidia bacterium]NNF81515.1 methyltransferase domain-containing protein [Flavobacteriaceae bacterium]NNK70184.1 methyltransferase domain-containing protein [Flavobacteriaceae bacterium]NNL81204.1 methyltransferase domain-containing protein [Flavobacteriaceae bacterium]